MVFRVSTLDVDLSTEEGVVVGLTEEEFHEIRFRNGLKSFLRKQGEGNTSDKEGGEIVEGEDSDH